MQQLHKGVVRTCVAPTRAHAGQLSWRQQLDWMERRSVAATGLLLQRGVRRCGAQHYCGLGALSRGWQGREGGLGTGGRGVMGECCAFTPVCAGRQPRRPCTLGRLVVVRAWLQMTSMRRALFAGVLLVVCNRDLNETAWCVRCGAT
jgi:hypothetical protein